MRPALHIDPPLASIPAALRAHGVDAFQTTLRDPQRFGKTGIPDADDIAAYRSSSEGLWGIAHGSLLINLASTDGRIRNSSKSSLLADLALAADLGFAGVCFHVGYAKGYAGPDDAIDAAARKIGQVLEDLPEGACAIIENSCEGTEIVQTVEQMSRLFGLLGASPEQLGLLIDTCHLHAAGFDLSSDQAGEQLASSLAEAGLLDRLKAFHLNDCEGPAGCKRDRHAVPGEGSIGRGLLSIVNHAAFADRPLILELSLEGALRGRDFLVRG